MNDGLWSSHPLILRLGNARFSMSRGKITISLVKKMSIAFYQKEKMSIALQ